MPSRVLWAPCEHAHCVQPRPVPRRRTGARLDGRDGHAVVDHPRCDNHLAAGEHIGRTSAPAPVGTARVGGRGEHREVARHVGAGFWEQQHLAPGGILGVDQHRQRVVVDHHEVSGVEALRVGLGHDGHHRLAHEPHHAVGEEGTPHGGVGEGEGWSWREVGEVGGGDDGDHAGGGDGLAHVHADDAGVGHRRAYVDHVGGAVETEAGDVAALSDDEAGILDAQHPRPENAAPGLAPLAVGCSEGCVMAARCPMNTSQRNTRGVVVPSSAVVGARTRGATRTPGEAHAHRARFPVGRLTIRRQRGVCRAGRARPSWATCWDTRGAGWS